MDSVNHLFGMGHTIEAAIRLYNGMDTSTEELEMLMEEFLRINPDNQIPKLYENCLIPILTKT